MKSQLKDILIHGSHHLCIGLVLGLLLATPMVFGQTRTMVGQNSTGCAADTVNPACKSGTSSNSSGSTSTSGHSSNAAKAQAIATGVETLIDIFTADSARKQQERREWDDQARQYEQGQVNAKNLFDNMAPTPKPTSATTNSGKFSSVNPWDEPDTVIRPSKEMGLERSQCLKVITNKSGSAYIGHLSVRNTCSEPISYAFCYLSGGGDDWGNWECKQNAQGYFERGSDLIAAGDTAVLPSSLSNTDVALAACAKHGLPFITSINQRQSGFVCR